MSLLSFPRRANIRGAAVALAAALATTQVAPVVAAPQGQILSLETGHSLIVRGRGISRVAVGDGKVAGAIALDPARVVLNAKAPGETTLFVWDADGQHTYELTVNDRRLEQIARLLQTQIDTPGVTIGVVGGTLILGGKVADLRAYGRVTTVLDRFKDVKFDGAPISIANTIAIAKPLGKLQDEIDAMPQSQDLRVDLDPTGDIVVSGRVQNRQQAQDVVDRVGGLAGPYLKSDGKIVDRLSTNTKSLVSIKVDVLEVDKTAQSQLGLRLQTATNASVGGGAGSFAIGAGNSLTAVENPARALSPNNPFKFGPFERVSLLAPTLDLLETQGHARLLSSPTLVALPGKSATFLVGGQIPIPVSNGLGTVSIEYKQFGVSLNVKPSIQADGGIDTELSPEISDLDFADGVQVNGFTVPALKTSKIQTEVITEDGESIVLGGLLRRIESRNIQKFPILGDLPILGQLFRSTSYQKTDSDVVFVLTPTIVTKRKVLLPEP